MLVSGSVTPIFFWQSLFDHFISLKVCVLDVSGSMGSRNKIDDLTLGFCNETLWWIVMSVTCGYMKRKIVYMDVSKNNGTPKSSVLIGISIINHPFWGTPVLGNAHI